MLWDSQAHCHVVIIHTNSRTVHCSMRSRALNVHTLNYEGTKRHHNNLMLCCPQNFHFLLFHHLSFLPQLNDPLLITNYANVQNCCKIFPHSTESKHMLTRLDRTQLGTFRPQTVPVALSTHLGTYNYTCHVNE